ncbi:MAG TPA: hypothetical protein VF576_10115 [Rubricoccaceae bacterium]|jgi:hypothetical protein
MRPLLAALVLALGGCDLPTAPEPLNPLDPAYEGVREATPPSDLRVAASTISEITLAWTDNSSFETGVRVERAFEPLYGGPPVWETLTVLPPNATAYTDRVESDAPRRYRLFAPAGRDSAPSATLAVRYRTERVPVDAAVEGTFASAEFSPDGGTVYAKTFNGIAVISAATGRLLGRFPEAGGVAGHLADGRVAIYVTSAFGTPLVRVYRGVDLESAVTLAAPTCGISGQGRVLVSADGTRAVAACRSGDGLISWRLSAPLTPVLHPLTPTSTSGEATVAGVSPDGRLAVGGAGQETVAFDLDARAVQWRAPVSAYGATLSPDGRLLLVSGGIATVNVRDAATGAVRAAADGQVFQGRFSGDGGSVAFAASGNAPALQVARASDLAPIGRLSGVSPTEARPTAGGAIAVDISGYPRSDVVRWDFGAGWEGVGG